MPPRPSSGQSDGNGPARLSHSPMVGQGAYPPPHSYKGHPGMASNQQIPLYQQAQYPQGGYPPRPPGGKE